MDYFTLTAPCGRDCFNCPLFLAKENPKLAAMFAHKYGMKKENVPCEGCRTIQGQCRFLQKQGHSEHCKIHQCVQNKRVDFCYQCADFPCQLLQPLARQPDWSPHNMKVYNLCLIKKLGLEKWARNRAKTDMDRFYSGKLEL